MALTPAQQAKFDQQTAEIREHVLELVRLFRAAKEQSDLPNAQASMLIGLALAGPSKIMSVAIMAVTLLAEQEEK